MWWWDGLRWVLANPAPAAAPPPPPAPPPAYGYLPPPYPYRPQGAGPLARSGLPVFLIVMLSVAAALNGLMGLVGTIAVTGGDTGAVSVSFWLLFIALFVLSSGALVGVVRRSTWGRWVALAAGIAVCFTILGSIIGIPIIVAAARGRIGKSG
jgi:hypothetical protein